MMGKKSLAVSALIAATVVPAVSSAAPGVLADKPLFLGSEVQPNIFFIVDDSGSMDWEVLKSNRALQIHGSGTNSGNMDFTPNNTAEILELCSGYNVMAYDPTKTYTPWVGVDEDGITYADKTLTTALHDPYDNDNLDDVSGHFYIKWNDKDKDGLYDNGECAVPTNYGSTLSRSECTAKASTCVGVNSLSSSAKKNYANWYTYYRKREYVAKRALSEIITNSNSRMGLATLHNNNSVGTEVKDVDDISLPIDTAAKANKLKLKKNLFRIYSSGGTPLRQTLKKAGDYFEVGKAPSSSLFGKTPNPTSPILDADSGGECQQNFSILMSDGTWNGSSPSVGNTDKNSENKFDGGSYADGVSNTLADVAMKYYKEDLAPTLANNVPVILGVDENDAQHMVTYTVAFGVNGTLTANPPNTTSSFAWPTPSSNSIKTIDDMRHAAWNGRGQFLSAGDPDELISSLASAIKGISDREGAASAVAFNSTGLATDTLVFQARFDSGGWHGTLAAFEFDEDGVGGLEWDAAKVLDTRNLSSSPREIITYNGTKGIAFEFPSNYRGLSSSDLSQAQVNDLLANSPHGVGATVGAQVALNQTFGEQLTDYLRGDFAHDGGQFRDRFDHRLGDIAHSSPAFVGAPNALYPDNIGSSSDLYSDFFKAKEKRTPVVYIGANDGMLHAFHGKTGEELMGYIPGLVFSDEAGRGLHYLSEKEYTHIPYVDGSPVAVDVYIDDDWATYLVGGLRAGGKGIYVLDVTNPGDLKEAKASDIVKMEFTHKDLGFSFSRPQVVKMNNGKWAAIFGNGYNNDPLGDGSAKLFVLYLDGSGHELIETKAGFVVNSNCQDFSSDCNGLSSPVVLDFNGDFVADRVYAGDLQGNLWAFDISSKNSTDWDVDYMDGGKPLPLFTACTSSTCTSGGKAVNRQPITSKPAVAVHPTELRLKTEPNLMVYFGTGQYFAENDNFTTDKQTMYGIWDAGSKNAGLERDDLQRQKISNTTTSGLVTRDITDNEVTYNERGLANAELGWYEDLPDLGERTVVTATVVGDILFYNTMVPEANSDGNSCLPGGKGYLMAVDRMTGGLPEATVFDLDNDGEFDDTLVAGFQIPAIPGPSTLFDEKLVTPDSSGGLRAPNVRAGKKRVSRRASWTVIR